MRKIVSGVFQVTKYKGVYLGMIVAGGEILFIDSPIKPDDAAQWLDEASSHGKVRYLAVLDSNPDRALGARALNLPIIAQLETLNDMRTWPDTFKGATHPIGSEVDSIKRITGVQKSIPELAFSIEMDLILGGESIIFLHMPGPREGSMWVWVPDRKLMFTGDAVTVDAPPYFGAIDLDLWLQSLDMLRDFEAKKIKLFSSRDGLFKRDDINNMARFVRKIPSRVEKVAESSDMDETAGKLADQLMRGFKIRSTDSDLVRRRVQASLVDLARYQRDQED